MRMLVIMMIYRDNEDTQEFSTLSLSLYVPFCTIVYLRMGTKLFAFYV